MRFLKQSTSTDVPIGPFLDSTDGITAETALTITQPDVRLKKNAAAWAQKAAAQTLAHEENGYYEVTLDATDTDTVGHMRLAVHEAGALPIWEDFMVLEEAVYDALYAASAAGFGVAQTGDSFARIGATGSGLTSLATPTNITAGTMTTVTNLTNAPTAGDLTTTMKTSVTTAATAATPVAASVTGAVGSVTGAVGSVTGLTAATVHSDLDDIQTRLPAALTAGGHIKADALAWNGLATVALPATPTNITAGTITTVTNLTNAPTAGDLTATMKASVNTEVLDVLNVDTFAEPGQGAPAATASLVAKLGYLFKAWRNRHTQTATEYALYADDTTTKDQEAAVTSDGTTTVRGEVGTGA